MSQKLQIPPASVPLMGPDGTLALEWRTFFNALISRAGGILGGLQPSDPTLDALAALNATPGLLAEVSADVFTKRSVAGSSTRNSTVNGLPLLASTSLVSLIS